MKPIRIIIVRAPSSGVDHISIEVEGPSPYPALDRAEPGRYPPFLKVETPKGYAETWLRLMGLEGVPTEVVGQNL
jgi:hypothetical protein